MKTLLVVTITCPDRPGIVEQITQIVVRYSANWEDSRMARLGGDFAGIVMISVAPEEADALKHALLDLANPETTIAVKTTRADDPAVSSPHTLCELQLTGADHEGIVHTISAFLA
ncbi:MAG: glycine cleavage system transcriptional repressor, partial [Pirellulaceae bacterium]